jgi:hypothetical protein
MCCCGYQWLYFERGAEMEVNIFRVRRNGNMYFAAYLNGSYIERASLDELQEVLRVRTNFSNIFAQPIAFLSKAGLQ